MANPDSEVHRELAKKLKELECRIEGHDSEITTIVDAIRGLVDPPQDPPKKIGFQAK